VSLKLLKSTRFRDVQKVVEEKYPSHFKKLRLYNIEGVELNEDDLEYVKNDTTLFASGGRNNAISLLDLLLCLIENYS